MTGTTTHQYDGAGQLIGTMDANGVTTSRQYDVLGRVTSSLSTRGGASETVTWTYDTAPSGIGRLASMTDPTGGTAYEYDHRGLLTKETKTIGAAEYVTSFAYDAAGNRTRMVYPGGRAVDYGFDFAGRPVSAVTGGTPLVTSARYLPFGPAAEIAFGNGTTKRMTFDARYRPVMNRLDGPSGAIARYRYGHDGAGNITGIADELDPGYDRAFGYDDLNRLVTANGGASLWGAGSYAYDAMGNLRSLALGTAKTSTFAYSGTTPKLTGVTENGASRVVSYDAAGNELTVGAAGFAYSPRNHVVDGDPIRYAYDGRGIRTITTRSTVIDLAAVAIAPASVTGGTAAEGVVTLTAPAPAGTIVRLTSSSASVTIPAQVNIEPGAVSATFAIETAPVAEETTVVITANLEGTTREASITILAPVLSALSFDTGSLYGGSSANGTVTLTGPAPSAGKSVTLASSSASLPVPSSVTIAAGASSVGFSATATPVETQTEALVTVTDGAIQRSAGLTILPPDLSFFTVTPATVTGGEAATAEARINAPAAAGGAPVAISSSDETLVPPASLIVPEGTTEGTVVLPTNPVAANASVVISATRHGVTLSSTITVAPPPVTIDSLAVEPLSLVGSNDATGTIALTDPAPAAGIEVEVFSSDPLVIVPSFLQLPAGTTEASFPIRTSLVTLSTPVTIGATHGATTKSAVLTLLPPPGNYVSSVSVTPAFIAGGLPATGTVTLSLPSSDNGGSDVVLASSDPDVIVPAQVTVKRNQTAAMFDIATNVVAGPRPVTLSAAYGGVLQRASVILAPENAVILSAVTIHPPRVLGGNPASGLLVLSAPAPFGGAVVSLSTSRRNMATVPDTVTIPEGVTTAAFPIATEPIHGNKDRLVEIEAVYNGITVVATLAIAPPAAAALGAPTTLALPPSGALADPPATTPAEIAKCASLALEPCLVTASAARLGTQAITLTESRYSLYSPELRLLAETGYSSAETKPIEYEYVWFGGQPLAQIESATGAVHWYFNDHLGTPILTTDTTGAVDWRVEREPYGEIYAVRAGAGRHQPLALPGQEDGGALSYNIFRWYRTGRGRYTQPDPIGLDGGDNLFLYAGADSIGALDPLGLAYFAKRPLGNKKVLAPVKCHPVANLLNIELAHEQLFFEDGQQPSNIGFFSDGTLQSDPSGGYGCKSGSYNDCIMRKAVGKVGTPQPYCLIGKAGAVEKFNCQDWATLVRKKYAELASDPQIVKECCGEK